MNVRIRPSLACLLPIFVATASATEVIEGDLEIHPDTILSEAGDLSLSGILNVSGAQINWGTTPSPGLLPAITGYYENTGSPVVRWSATEAAATWYWQDNEGGVPRLKMTLDGANALLLHNDAGAATIRFEPNAVTPTIKVGTEKVLTTIDNGATVPYLTQIQGGALYMPLSPASATMSQSLTVGTRSTWGSTGQRSFAAGQSLVASGINSAAFGYGASAQGENSLAAGTYANASGYSSVALGYDSTSSGWSSFAAGTYANAAGDYSIALGEGAQALAYSSFAFGDYSHAEGERAVALGGDAYGQRSVAFNGGDAHGTRSFAFGRDTDAYGYASVSGGEETRAYADHSFVFGYETRASAWAQTVFGHYNVEQGDPDLDEYDFENGEFDNDEDLFILGNGREVEIDYEWMTVRSNAFVVRRNGDAAVAGTNSSEKQGTPKGSSSSKWTLTSTPDRWLPGIGKPIRRSATMTAEGGLRLHPREPTWFASSGRSAGPTNRVSTIRR